MLSPPSRRPHTTPSTAPKRRSRTAPVPLIAALFLVPAACSSLDNVSVSAEGTAVIPERTIIDDLLGAVAFTGFDRFDISQSQEFRDQGYTKEQIDSVRMERFVLTIESPAGTNFDFLDSIHFTISADDLPTAEIAHLEPIPAGAAELRLEIDGSLELQSYVVAPSVTITTDATGTRPSEETTVFAEAVFDVDVNVSGALR